jgi:hypothetical protein
MTNKQPNETLNELNNQVKNWVAKGNQRHVVIRKADGEKLVELNLTIAIILGIAIIFLLPISWTLVALLFIAGIVMKLRIELVHDLTEKDNVVQVDLSDDE